MMNWANFFDELSQSQENVGPSFESALFPKAWSWHERARIELFSKEQKRDQKAVSKESTGVSYFINKKNEEQKNKRPLREKVTEERAQVSTMATSDQQKSSLFFHFDKEVKQVRKLKLAFISREFVLDESEQSESLNLLHKITEATGLERGEVAIYSHCQLESNDQEREKEKIASFLLESKPDFVLTLGGPVTGLFLGQRQRLAKIHGTFNPFHIQVKESRVYSFQVVPFFHTDYLLINPKMKRVAWDDLKKVLKALSH